jgi:hypothetical protein
MKMLSGPAVGTTSSDSKLADESDSLYSFSVHSRPPVIANTGQSFAGDEQNVELELSKRLLSIRMGFRCGGCQPLMALGA